MARFMSFLVYVVVAALCAAVWFGASMGLVALLRASPAWAWVAAAIAFCAALLTMALVCGGSRKEGEG